MSEGGEDRPVIRPAIRCTYKRGVCHLHGRGARKYYQPVKVRKVGPDGEVTRVTQKKAYYQCDLGQRGGGLRQPRISFMTRDSDDNAVGYLGCSNTSVGQYLGISRDEQGKETLDEN